MTTCHYGSIERGVISESNSVGILISCLHHLSLSLLYILRMGSTEAFDYNIAFVPKSQARGTSCIFSQSAIRTLISESPNIFFICTANSVQNYHPHIHYYRKLLIRREPTKSISFHSFSFHLHFIKLNLHGRFLIIKCLLTFRIGHWKSWMRAFTLIHAGIIFDKLNRRIWLYDHIIYPWTDIGQNPQQRFSTYDVIIFTIAALTCVCAVYVPWLNCIL